MVVVSLIKGHTFFGMCHAHCDEQDNCDGALHGELELKKKISNLNESYHM